MPTTLHVLAPFHSRILLGNSQCAFAALVLRFAKMMRAQGFRVVEYHAGSHSESEADEHVSVTDTETWERFWKTTEGRGASPGNLDPGALVHFNNLLVLLQRRVGLGDIVCHTYGDAYQWFVNNGLPVQLRHVETQIGYDRPPFGADRIFPSEAWRHHHFGKYSHTAEVMSRSEAIPHYFDESDWTINLHDTPQKEPRYIAYCGRLTKSKHGILPELVRRLPEERFKIAGTGDTALFEGLPNVELMGAVKGRDRDAFLGGATCLVCPTEFVEPFGAVAIEAAFCGTPTVGPNYGAYVETLGDFELGVRARSRNWRDWFGAIRIAQSLSRLKVAELARKRYNLSVIGQAYSRFFHKT